MLTGREAEPFVRKLLLRLDLVIEAALICALVARDEGLGALASRLDIELGQ
jgi:hypothetical protein